MTAIDYTEALISKDPVIVRRRVLWGECDPAGVVYTPKFTEYAASARDWFLRIGLGVLDRPHPSRPALTYPMKAMSFEFVSFLAADDLFDMTTTVSHIGRRTFTLEIEAKKGDDVSFRATLVAICFDSATRVSVELPAEVRTALERYL